MTPTLKSPQDAITTARLLAPRLNGRAEAHDRSGTFPVDDFADLRNSGLMGLMVPERLGGPGSGFTEYVEVAMALAAGNGATALIYNMHTSITGALANTSDDMARTLGVSDAYFDTRDRMLSKALSGEFFAVAMSERGSGSRLSAVTTTYTPIENGYHLSGSKAFVSGAGHADAYLVAARSTNPDAPDVSHFLVPAGDGAGITIEETWDSLGMRATGSQDVHFDVVVDEDMLLGGMEGLTVPLALIMPQWLVASYAAVYVGVAQAALGAAIAHVNERGLAKLPAIRARLGRADAAIAAARLSIQEAARRIDDAPGAEETNRWVYRAKLLAGQTAMDVGASMLEAAGTSATRRGHPLERLYRDARCGALQPATSDVCADWLGIAALGGDPETDADVPRW